MITGHNNYRHPTATFDLLDLLDELPAILDLGEPSAGARRYLQISQDVIVVVGLDCFPDSFFACFMY